MKILMKPNSPSNMSTAPVSKAAMEIRGENVFGSTWRVMIRRERAPAATALSMKSLGRMVITSLRTNSIISPQPTRHKAITNDCIPWRIPIARIRIMVNKRVGKAERTSARPTIERSSKLPLVQPATAPNTKPIRRRAETASKARVRVCWAPARMRLMMPRPRASVPQG